MSNVRLYMNTVNGWEKMDTAMSSNDLEISPLGFKLPALRAKSTLMRSLYARHAALAAERQTITQEMQQLIEEGDQIFRAIKEGLREYYGKRNEKLVEFGVDPLRSRIIQRVVRPPLPEAPAPLAPTPDPAK